MKLSIIIPARNEFPNIIHTIYSLIHSLEIDGFTEDDYEIIVINNCSTDWTIDGYEWQKPGVKGTTSYFMPRGMYWHKVVKMIYDPIAGNHSARNKGAKIARGEYLFFSDAHMAYRPGIFKMLMKAVDESGGIVHCPIAWMGAYPPKASGVGYGYTLKLGEEFKGTWNNYQLDDKEWFYIPALGHCSLMVKKDQFLAFGGYPKIHRTYGGGEIYLNMKWWMFGSSVAVHPQAIGYHLASSRGYTYHHDDYIENVLGCAYALGADEWRERAYINWMRNGRKEVLDSIMARSAIEHESDRKFVNKNKKYSFNDLLKEEPWNKKNKERLGKANGGMLIFHDTWLQLLRKSPQYVQDVYDNSQLQKDLEKFINENLSKYVYKR